MLTFSLLGALIGASIPATALLLFWLGTLSKVPISEQLIPCLAMFFLAFMELPVVALGRALKLPIEGATGVAFILFDLNNFGYVLVFSFWAIVGLIAGCTIRLIA